MECVFITEKKNKKINKTFMYHEATKTLQTDLETITSLLSIDVKIIEK